MSVPALAGVGRNLFVGSHTVVARSHVSRLTSLGGRTISRLTSCHRSFSSLPSFSKFDQIHSPLHAKTKHADQKSSRGYILGSAGCYLALLASDSRKKRKDLPVEDREIDVEICSKKQKKSINEIIQSMISTAK